jgi:methionine-rich copper-binding protein CopC
MKLIAATRQVVVLSIAVLLTFWSSEQVSSAHAILVEAVPAADSTIAGPDISVKLRFNSRIDGARSRLALVGPDTAVRQLELQPQSSPDRLSSQAAGLKPGPYALRWQVLATDGHITRGEIRFEVK